MTQRWEGKCRENASHIGLAQACPNNELPYIIQLNNNITECIIIQTKGISLFLLLLVLVAVCPVQQPSFSCLPAASVSSLPFSAVVSSPLLLLLLLLLPLPLPPTLQEFPSQIQNPIHHHLPPSPLSLASHWVALMAGSEYCHDVINNMVGK